MQLVAQLRETNGHMMSTAREICPVDTNPVMGQKNGRKVALTRRESKYTCTELETLSKELWAKRG